MFIYLTSSTILKKTCSANNTSELNNHNNQQYLIIPNTTLFDIYENREGVFNPNFQVDSEQEPSPVVPLGAGDIHLCEDSVSANHNTGNENISTQSREINKELNVQVISDIDGVTTCEITCNNNERFNNS